MDTTGPERRETFVDDVRTSFWEEADDVGGRQLSLRLVGTLPPRPQENPEALDSSSSGIGYPTLPSPGTLSGQLLVASLHLTRS
jgi:hypothetical protein